MDEAHPLLARADIERAFAALADELFVRAASTGHLLAMKLAAWRDEIDIADARLLLSKIPGDFETVWSLIGGTLEAGARAQARYNYEDLWEDVHGSR